MTEIIVAFIAGLIIGEFLTVFILAMCDASRDDDEEKEV